MECKFRLNFLIPLDKGTHHRRAEVSYQSIWNKLKCRLGNSNYCIMRLIHLNISRKGSDILSHSLCDSSQYKSKVWLLSSVNKWFKTALMLKILQNPEPIHSHNIFLRSNALKNSQASIRLNYESTFPLHSRHMRECHVSVIHRHDTESVIWKDFSPRCWFQ